MNGAVHFTEPKPGVEVDAVNIFEFGVAGEFMKASGTSPVFNERKERAADAAVAVSFCHEPAFEIWNGSFGCALDMVAADGDLSEADDLRPDASEGDNTFAG